MVVTVPRERLRQVVRLQAVALGAVCHGDDLDRPRAVRLQVSANRVTVYLGTLSTPYSRTLRTVGRSGLLPCAPRQACLLQHPAPFGYGASTAYPVKALVVGGLVVDRDLHAFSEQRKQGLVRVCIWGREGMDRQLFMQCSAPGVLRCAMRLNSHRVWPCVRVPRGCSGCLVLAYRRYACVDCHDLGSKPVCS